MNISELFRKTFAVPKAVSHQAGQAVVEYILLLVIIVSIVLGVLYQFNTAFSSFLDNYFGDYLECLLETGELPAVSGGGLSAGECTANFENFSLANGRPKIQDSGSSGDGPVSSGGGEARSLTGGRATGQGQASGQGPQASSGGQGSRSGGASRGAGSLSSGSYSRGGSRNSESYGRNNLRPARQSLQLGGGNKESTSSTAGEGSGGNSGDGSIGSIRSGRRGRRRIVYLDEEYVTEKDKKKKLVRGSGKKVKTNLRESGEVAALRRPIIPLKVPEVRGPAKENDDGLGLNLGFFIKFLMIGGILIALFVFLGGQALQIKKSWQKSD